ncbi:pentapeptide repeat-containing protein [Streptomyces sp. N35]|uniref:pentapeptide repeat-containing protein n=1 Tax=Streptomyces sp. N35 TaxID=2795730 RepID=UPI0018F6A381|nr:pentapeptide repeat-containing protein [Streptomyces sp. N35]
MYVEWLSGADWDRMDGAARAAAVGQFRLAVVQVLAAIGAGVALTFTAFNYRLSRRGQVTDRFTKALERLGSDRLYVRLGGIRALEQIVEDAPDQATHACQVLLTFVREQTPRALDGIPGEHNRIVSARRSAKRKMDLALAATPLPSKPAEDVHAALEVLLTRLGGPGLFVQLSGLHLAGLELDGVDLALSALAGTDLSSSVMWDSNFSEAILDNANLSGAHFAGSHFQGATLRGANLSSAILWGVDFSEAELNGAILEGASLWREGAHAGPALVDVEQLLTAKLDRGTILPPDIAADARIVARLNEEGLPGNAVSVDEAD